MIQVIDKRKIIWHAFFNDWETSENNSFEHMLKKRNVERWTVIRKQFILSFGAITEKGAHA